MSRSKILLVSDNCRRPTGIAEVIKVNSSKPERTSRRRRCKDCRALFQTLEIIIDGCDVGERVSVDDRLIAPLVEEVRAALRKRFSN